MTSVVQLKLFVYYNKILSLNLCSWFLDKTDTKEIKITVAKWSHKGFPFIIVTLALLKLPTSGETILLVSFRQKYLFSTLGSKTKT